ncbi:MAG: ATP-binding protein [Thermoanaerobaculia bacterium]|jgi:two-component system nitrogen regulation sensor histidine kinase NtrY
MALRERFQAYRKDTRWIIGGLAILLLALSLLYYLTQRGQDLPSELVTNRVLLFVLWYINLTLILAVLFVLARNLFKLVMERHNRILGSRFKTRLVATYIGLSLIPVLLLFAYGSRMLQGWIDRWFDEPAIQEVATQGHAVAQELFRQIEQTALRDTERALLEIEEESPRNPRRRPQVQRRMGQLLEELDLDFLAVYDGTQFVHALLNPQSGLEDLPEPGERFLVEALRHSQATRMVSVGGGEERLVLTAVAAGGDGEVLEGRTLTVAGTLIDADIASKSRQLIQAYQGYRQLEVSKSRIEAGYLLNFLMVTLLILLASSWVGLYLARQITVPIQALAEATKRISDGDLDFQVEVDADDELGVLVHSFNSMTAELQRNKELLEESNLELLMSNQRLAEERAVISAVLQNLAAGVISVDEEGTVLTCNGAALKMLQQEESDCIGRPVREAWSDPERGKLAKLFEMDAGQSRRITQDFRMMLGDDWKTFEAKVTTMQDRHGMVSGRVMVLEELTELVKAQQMAAWSEAARRIAHEIKNPLTPIRLSAERMLKKHEQKAPDLGETLEEGVELIKREVEAMKSMVDEFSRFARMPLPRPSEVELEGFVDEALNLYRGIKPGVEVTARIDDDAQSARFDAEQIKRALINLLDNALDATEAPGEVSVAVHRHNGSLEINISDTGEGIPPDAKEKLFLPHFSTKRRGTGLGLSIVHRIISDHHGTIQADDNDPQGTIFTITLPQQ